MEADRLTGRELLRLALVVTAVTAAALAFAWLLPSVRAGEALFDDYLIARYAPAPPQRDDIAVIALDEGTLADLACRSPIDRLFLADTIGRLEAAGVRAIGLDVLFDGPTLPRADAALAEALATATVPVVVITALDDTPLLDRQRAFLDDFLDGRLAGHANLAKDVLDGTVRRHRPVSADGTLSFPAALARTAGTTPPDRPFAIDWVRGPDPETPPVPVYPANAASLLPDDWLADRIVLVGVVAEGVDRHRTPLDRFGRPTPGVLIQAQVLAQMLDGRSAPQRGPAMAIILTLALAATGAMLGRLAGATAARIAAGFAALILGLVAIWGGAVAAMAGAGVLLPTASPSLALIGAAGIELALSIRRERRRRDAVSRLFSAHVSPGVARQLWRERDSFLAGGRPKPQDLFATVMFTDIAGSTAVAEALPPEPLMRWLDGYIARMTEIVEAEGGVVLRFVGDGILAAFGVPVPRKSDTECAADARHALSAARAMAAAVADLNDDQARQGLPAIGLRIGIHSGPVTAGSVGGGTHLEYALIGDTANVAARLEGLAREVDPMAGGPCRTVVSDATRRLAGEPTGETVETVGTLTLRGRTAPMAAWRLVR